MVFPGQFIRPSARKMTQAYRAGALFDELYLARDGRPLGGNLSTLTVPVVNEGDSDVPAFGLLRWFGDPLKAAEIDGEVPQLILRSSTDSDAAIGVAPQQILAADSAADPPRLAQIGPLQILGVCWARCRGEITAGDSLAPDEEFYGVTTEGSSNVTALADVPAYEEAIIPVLIGSPGETVCEGGWYFSAEGMPAGGTSEWEVTVNGVTEAVELPCPCSIAQTRSALATHSEIAPGDVTIVGGALPTSSQKVTFRRNPTDISLVENLLTRSWTAPPGYFWDPI